MKLPGESVNLPNTYTVKKGDSLWSIANKYGINANDLKSLNKLSSNILSVGQVLMLPGITEEDTINTYTVKLGDTLYGIANKYNISVDKLKQLNNLTSNTLSVGQTLNIRDTSNDILSEDYDYYTVKSGDTLYSIANKYGVDVNSIKDINNLNSNILNVGQLIKIPDSLLNTYIVKKGDTIFMGNNE